jgi:hypothetical protein
MIILYLLKIFFFSFLKHSFDFLFYFLTFFGIIIWIASWPNHGSNLICISSNWTNWYGRWVLIDKFKRIINIILTWTWLTISFLVKSIFSTHKWYNSYIFFLFVLIIEILMIDRIIATDITFFLRFYLLYNTIRSWSKW